MKIKLFSNWKEKRISPAELLVMSNEIQALHINTKVDNGIIKHTFPLINLNGRSMDIKNWELDEKTIEEIQKKRIHLEKYGSRMVKKYRPFSSNEIKIKEQLLPPWVVYPLFDARDMGWRMGTGEAYEALFVKFFKKLSQEEKEEYMKTYPMPEYIEIRFGDLYRLEQQ